MSHYYQRDRLSPVAPLNLWNAIMGVFFGFWLQELSKDVLSSSSLGNLPPIAVSLFKVGFILSTIMYLVILAFYTQRWHQALHAFSHLSSYRSVWKILGGSTLRLGFMLLLAYVSLVLTSFVIQRDVNVFWIAFLMALFPAWLLTATVLRLTEPIVIPPEGNEGTPVPNNRAKGKGSKRRNSRRTPTLLVAYLIAGVGFLFIFIKLFLPTLPVDAYTVTIYIFASCVLLLPDLVKRIDLKRNDDQR